MLLSEIAHLEKRIKLLLNSICLTSVKIVHKSLRRWLELSNEHIEKSLGNNGQMIYARQLQNTEHNRTKSLQYISS